MAFARKVAVGLLAIACCLPPIIGLDSGPAGASPPLLFSLGFGYEGDAYVAVVYGNTSQYAPIQTTWSNDGSVAPEAVYLQEGLQGTVPLYAVSIFPGTPGHLLSPEVTGPLRSAMLSDLFDWAWVYRWVEAVDNSFNSEDSPPETFMNEILNFPGGPISEEWAQQLGIDAAAVLNWLTLTAPLVDALQDVMSSTGVEQVGDFVNLLETALSGSSDLESAYEQEGSTLLSTLENDHLVPGSGYLGAQLLNNLREEPLPSAISTVDQLYNTAYPGQPLTPQASSAINSFVGQILSWNTGEGVATSGVVGAAEAYFGAQSLGVELTSQQVLSSGAAAASEDLIGSEVPLALAGALNEAFIQPEASMLQDEVDAEDAEQTLFSDFETERSVLAYDTPQSINLAAGDQLASDYGLMEALGLSWTSTDVNLINSEGVRCFIDPSTCSGWKTLDSSLESSFQSDIGGLVSYENLAANAGSTLTADVLSITTTSLPGAMIDSPYSVSLQAIGGDAPVSWTVSSGSLPNGISLSSSGVLSGTPTSEGSAQFTVTATDSGSPQQSAVQALSMAVGPNVLSASNQTLPPAEVGEAYQGLLNVSGGTPPYQWTVTSGSSPPSGLHLSASGLLSGVPQSAGSDDFEAQVTDSSSPPQSATVTISLVVSTQTLIVTSTVLNAGQVGVFYEQFLTATGGTEPYSWSISAGQLPPGLNFAAGTSGAIYGTPTTTGTYPFTVKVTDSSSPSLSATAPLSVSISPGSVAITTQLLPQATEGDNYSETLDATGGDPPYAWSITSGSLPNGLQLNDETGLIYGDPFPTGVSTFTVQATDNESPQEVAQATLTLEVLPHPLAIESPYLFAGYVGEGYSAELAAQWGAPPYTWSVSVGQLPTGLSLNSATGQITGVPTVAGSSSLTFEVTDSENATATAALTLAILDLSSALSPVSPATDGSGDVLNGISCPGANDCVAVGQSGQGVALVQQFNGSSWTIQPFSEPLSSDNLLGVSCSSASSCVAVGDYPGSSAKQTLALVWNGSTWTTETGADATTTADNVLTAVSCPSSTFCMGVGWYLSPSGTYTPLSETWNGANWSVIGAPAPGGQGALVTAVSCTSSTFCAAAGNYYPAGGTQNGFVSTWNGSSWSTNSAPTANLYALTGVSCNSVNACQAVGSLVPSGGGSEYPVVLSWNGTSWSTTTSFTDSFNATLAGVSCASSTECVAIGEDFTGNQGSLIMLLTDGSWVVEPSPEGVGSTPSLAGVSCGPGYCAAIGPGPAILISGSMVFSNPIAPSISSLSGSPSSVGSAGGTITLDWASANAPACSISSSPTITTLPIDVPCSNGSATVTIPPNTTQGAENYVFTLNAFGAGGTTPAVMSFGPVSAGAGAFSTWSEYSNTAPVQDGSSTAQACSGSMCYMVAVHDSNYLGVWSSSNDGQSWPTEDTLTSTEIAGDTCPATTAGSCVAAVGQTAYVLADNRQSSGVVFKTTNGGQSFVEQSLPGDSGSPVAAISCPDANDCYVYGSGYFWETSNGGSSWSESSPSLNDEIDGDLSCPAVNVCVLGSGGSWITTNGGTTWTTFAPPAGATDPVFCLNTSTCWLASNNGFASTVNGGTTWVTGSAVGPSPSQIACSSSSTCIAITNTAIYQSNDGAMTWTQQTSGTSSVLLVHSVDPSSAGLVVEGIDNNGYMADWDPSSPSNVAQAIVFISVPPTYAEVGQTYAVSAAGGGSGNAVQFSISGASSSICSISGSTVTFTAVGSCTIDANQTGGGSFTTAPQVQQVVAVESGTQSIAITSNPPSDAVVGGVYALSALTGASANPVTYTGTTGVCSISGSQAEFVGVGTCVIAANEAGNTNYLAAPQVTQSFTVSQATQTVSFTTTPPSQPIVGDTYTVEASGGASGNPVTISVDPASSALCAISGSTVTFDALGTCTLDANEAGNTNYLAANEVQQDIVVGQGTQTISFTAASPTSARVGGSYTPSALASSGLPVTLSIDTSSTSGACSYSNITGVVSFTGVGTCVIDANQAGNASYGSAPQVQESFSILQSSTLTQTSPISATTTPSGSGSYTSQLTVSGSSGTVSYTQTTGSSSITVSSTGAISTTGSLALGSYTATGSDSDTNGDTGTWTFTLQAAVASPSVAISAPGANSAGTLIASSAISSVLAFGQNASGSITFKVFGPGTAPATCTGGTVVGTATITGNGAYHPSVGFTPITAGDYWWYASYGGDANNAAASSSCGSGMPETVVGSGAATQLVITTQPSASAVSGVELPQQPVVQVEDAYGNVVTSVNSGFATAVIASGSGGTITDGTSGSFTFGVAVFSELALAGASGTNYTLQFSGDGLTSVFSQSIAMSAGPAVQLAFTTEPSNGTSGAVLATQPTVKVEDADGNLVSSTAPVTLSVQGGTISGCTDPLSAVGGVANFSECVVTGSGGQYTMTASSAGLTPATSTSFVLAPPGGTPLFTSSFTVTATQGSSTQFAVNASGTPVPTISEMATTAPTGANEVSFMEGNGSGTLTVGTATPAGTYTVSLSATNTAGTALQSLTVNVVASGAPTNVVAAASTTVAGQVTVTWMAPAAGGVSSYTITPTDTTTNTVGSAIVVSGSTLSVAFNSLTAGHAYDFIVGATPGTTAPANLNSTGAGQPVIPVATAPSSTATGNTSTSSNGSSTATIGTSGQSGSITASATGEGTVSVATYSGDPAGSGFSPPSGTASYDVAISAGSDISTLSFTICGVPTSGSNAGVILWFNPTTQGTVGVSPSPTATGTSGCYQANLSGSSTPTIAQLTGSLFFVEPSSGNSGSGGGGSGSGSGSGGGSGSGSGGGGAALGGGGFTQVPQTITFTSVPPSNASVGGTYAVSATASSGSPVTFSIDPSSAGICTINGSTVTFVAAGTCMIDASQSGSTFIAQAQGSQTVTVALGLQTVSFTSNPPSGAKVGESYSVSATSSAGLPVTFTIDSSAAGICQVSGGTVTFLAVGICVIDATQAGNAAYGPAALVTQSIMVSPAPSTTSAPTPTAKPPKKTKPKVQTSVSFLGANLIVASGEVSVGLSCRSAVCSGSVALTMPISGTPIKNRKPVVPEMIGSSSYSIGAGKSENVAVHLNPIGRSTLLRPRRSSNVEISITVRGGKSVSKLLVI